MQRPEQKRGFGLAWWLAAGFFVGAAVACSEIWPDFYRRLSWAAGGGRGESADWGEPLFYMVVMGVPAGLIGTAIAWVVALAIGRMTRKTR